MPEVETAAARYEAGHSMNRPTRRRAWRRHLRQNRGPVDSRHRGRGEVTGPSWLSGGYTVGRLGLPTLSMTSVNR